MTKSTTKLTEKMTKTFNQAKDSLKILETLEKETLAKAKSLVSNAKLPTAEEGRRLTNEKIVVGLKKIGLVTKAEFEERVEALEARIATHEAAVALTAGKTN